MTNNFNANQWYYITETRDASTGKVSLYIDGIFQSSATRLGSITFNGSSLSIGAFDSGASTQFNGLIDEVRIYDYARTPAQIAWDFNRGAPIAHWKMDEGQDTETTCNATGLTVYDSIGSNDGTLSLTPAGNTDPATARVEGKYNCALDFDGTDDYVTFTPPAANQATVSLWFRPENGWSSAETQNDYFLRTTNSGGWNTGDVSMLLSSADGKLWVYDGTAGAHLSSDRSSWNPEWYHAVWIRDGTNLSLYVNAVSDGTPISDTSGLTNRLIYLGSYYTAGAPFNGSIDDVKIFNYALTAEQIRTEYNQASAVRFGPTEGLP